MDVNVKEILSRLGIDPVNPSWSTGGTWGEAPPDKAEPITSPVDGQAFARIVRAGPADFETVVNAAQKAFPTWRAYPAPKRGDIVRQIGDRLRRQKEDLGALVSWEMGKSLQEGWGEVQEMIDRSEEHTSELQSIMRSSYAVFCLKKKN